MPPFHNLLNYCSMNFRSCFAAAISLSLVFCSGKSDQEIAIIPYELQSAFSLALPDHPSSTSSLQAVKVGDKELLFWGDVKRFDRIHVFNITIKSWEPPILYELQGPNGIGRLDGFFVKSRDSIYTVHSFGWRINLMNESQKLGSYSTRAGLDPTEVITPFTSENSLSGIIGNKLVFYGFPELSPRETSYYSNGKTGQVMDLGTMESTVGAPYPPQYRGHQWPGVNTISDRQAVIGGMIAHSFSLSDTVFLYDQNYGLVKKVRMYSRKKLPTQSFDTEGFEVAAGEKGYLEMLSKGFYSAIIADERNGILYRTVSYSDFEPANFELFSDYKQTAKRGLIIYDLKKDSLVGEIFFQPGEVDDVPMMFVGEKGLYLSKRNPLEEGVEFKLLKW